MSVKTMRSVLHVRVPILISPQQKSQFYRVSCVLRRMDGPSEKDCDFDFETRSVTIDPLETISRWGFDRLYLGFVDDDRCRMIADACRISWRIQGRWHHDDKVNIRKYMGRSYGSHTVSERRYVQELRNTFASEKERDPSFRESIEEALKEVWLKAEPMLDGLMRDTVAKTDNAQLRSKYHRSRLCYHDPSNIIYDLFPGRFSVEDGLRDPYVGRHAAVFPPFIHTKPYDKDGNMLPWHEEGMSSALISFGADPVPYAVVLVADVKALSGDSSRSLSILGNPRLYAVARVGDGMMIKPLGVSYDAPEEQLELAVLMALGDSISTKKPS